MADHRTRADAEQPEPPRLRMLRWLVVGLTATMIVGLLVIIALMVMTFIGTRDRRGAGADLADPLVLPAGQSARAYTQGTGWSAVVTRDADGVERILIFDPTNGAIRQTVTIE